MNAMKEEINRLTGNARKSGYSQVDEAYSNGNSKSNDYYDDQYNISQTTPRVSKSWKIAGFITIAAFFIFGTRVGVFYVEEEPQCKFCDQEMPTLHHDKSYTLLLSGEDGDNEPTVVTPMTISYDYELRDGEILFTHSRYELIPNLGYDYAVLGVGAMRNLYRDTREDVSLDEVYVHHLNILPINMLGAEVLNRDNEDDPYMRLPEGYALHVTDEETPYLRTNAHLLSNKNLAPIEGSQELAHKECNECYYAPTKGSDCTPEVSGTFLCCGDSPACTEGGEECFCPTTRMPTHTRGKSTTTKYTLELDVLVSTDIHKFQRVDQWNFAAPSCSVNIVGDSILEDYPSDSYCAKPSLLPKQYTKAMSSAHAVLSTGDGALFHQVYENNEAPYLRTSVSVLAPTGGKIVWAQSHLHTGGVNATLYKNGVPVCSTKAQHGTNEDSSTNARNERNHLIRISSCYDQIKSGIRFEKDDVFTTESYYYAGTDDARFSNTLAAGEHRNVMSMFPTGVVFDGTSDFLTEHRTSFNEWNDFVHVAGLRRSHATKGKH